ncbi:large-conductance mechanosensitive channel protein MscL [Pseudoroseomonas wenyumeiae]|uniref:Large-conductance mechanosensitive channel n=1 Tax=Teichococcus wenyumeiae TaxID=2478470 RepID=A0A3A9J735_9PROT|nr:large-conductance mechanosensitive channel protein MscL [Pseudoroseomonas wenyumeiae]RKK01750.1 large-conductance mechanosensitive channel protein MscL [Pseudoroseomonas wenyumeiae]RMI26874.1 large-conductance mechanosensitive channel protein MscL [Pseudoroseomonas wenyumeiae]
MSASTPSWTPGWVQQFKSFITRGNVVDLAVGIIIGAAFTSIVSALVEDILNPLIGLLVGGVDFSNIFVVVKGERLPTLEATRNAGSVVLGIGVFLNACIKFLIVAFAVFWVVQLMTRFNLRAEAEKKAAGPTPTEVLLAEIRDELRRRPL